MTQCAECGHEIPDDLDFCPACGCLRGSGPTPPPRGPEGSQSYEENVCPNCGRAYEPGSAYCGGCGAKLPPSTAQYSAGGFYQQPPKMGRREQVAVLLAFIPGFFNIFGLGHLVVKSYARGAMFLVISLVMWYLNDWSFMSSSFWLVLLELLIYFYQAMDIIRVIATEPR